MNRLKSKSTFLIIVLTLISLYSINISFQGNGLITEKNSSILKTNAIYQVPSITVDDTNPTANWSVFAAAGYPWFSGSGILSDPYVIQDVEVTSGDITIRNSIVHFRIQDCEGAIELYDVVNGKLVNNNCSNTFFNGIKLQDSNNTKISGNIINENHEGGLYLFNSHNNTIFGNTANSNWYPNHGISISFDSSGNTLENNVAKFHAYHGINIHGLNNTIKGNFVEQNSHGIYITGENNTIVGNTAFNNFRSGIFLSWGDYSNITGNFVNYNEEFGIRLRYSSHITVSNNTGYINGFSGVLFEDVHDITASGNSMCGSGYFFHTMTSSSLSSLEIDSSNLVNKKPFYYYTNLDGLNPTDFNNAGQILMLNCSNSLISNLDVSNGTIGIWLMNCFNNTFQNIESSYNIFLGIYLSNSNNITIDGCTTNENGNSGILLYLCENCSITASEANYNNLLLNVFFDGLGNGISLDESHNNTILGNTATNNDVSGIYVNFGDDNIISENTADYNGENGIYIEGGNTGWEIKYCLYNLILDNGVLDNGDYGIHLDYCMNNSLKENTAQLHQTQINGGIQVDEYGIFLEDSYYCNISENDISENEVGIVISRSSNNLIYRNHMIGDLSSNIFLFWAGNNVISENVVESVTPWAAIELRNSHNNTIVKNEVINGGTALWLEESNFNEIIENYFHDLGATALIFSDGSSYNIIINNTIRRCSRCFGESDSCIGNVFENNICEEGYSPAIFGYNSFLIVIVISIISIIIIIKPRKKQH